ncbi:hypothetical protein ACFL1G_02215 [Planctomycetota bacterium]
MKRSIFGYHITKYYAGEYFTAYFTQCYIRGLHLIDFSGVERQFRQIILP